MSLKIHPLKSFAPATVKRAMAFALAIAPFFTVIAIIQILFTRHAMRASMLAEHESWANEINEQIAYKGKWDLKGYRNASIVAPSWYVLSSNGFVIDIEGYVPGFFPPAKMIDVALANPKTVSTEVGESWRLFTRSFEDGMVIVGERIDEADSSTATLDHLLETNAARFGNTLAQAVDTSSRNIDFDIDYVVLKNNGEILMAWGGVPLKVDTKIFSREATDVELIKSKDKLFLISATALRDSQDHKIGTIYIPRDITVAEQTLRFQSWFNIWVAAVLWLIVVCLSIPFVHGVIRRQQRLAMLKDALSNEKLKEDHRIEFKPAYQWDSRTIQRNLELRLDFFLKPIAAFLNADGGTLIIGVNDHGKICGIEDDMAVFNGSTDKMQLEMMQLLTSKIGSGFVRFVQVHFANIGNPNPKLICLVDVEEARRPAFVKWNNNQIHFFVRAGNKSDALNPMESQEYIQMRWA